VETPKDAKDEKKEAEQPDGATSAPTAPTADAVRPLVTGPLGSQAALATTVKKEGGDEFSPLFPQSGQAMPQMSLTAFTSELEHFEEKPWRQSGANQADYFNYGFTETTWSLYLQKQKNFRSQNQPLQVFDPQERLQKGDGPVVQAVNAEPVVVNASYANERPNNIPEPQREQREPLPQRRDDRRDYRRDNFRGDDRRRDDRRDDRRRHDRRDDGRDYRRMSGRKRPREHFNDARDYPPAKRRR